MVTGVPRRTECGFPDRAPDTPPPTFSRKIGLTYLICIWQPRRRIVSISKARLLPTLVTLVSVSISLTACGSANSQPSDPAGASQSAGATTVTIQDNRGSVTIPVPAKSVIVTDNRLFQPLQEWGVKLSAAPQEIIAKGSPYKTDSSIVNLGDHREPNMEAAVGVQPDLIINGQRFKDKYDQFKQLTPEAALVDIDIRDEKDENGKLKYKFDEELKRQVTVAGEIFGKKDEAAKLVSDFDASIARVKAAYKPGSKVMAVIVSKGKVNYAAPGSGRTLGPVFEILGLTPALESQGSSDHQGDEISVEAIAQSNPDWILAMDRDGAITAEGETVTPASEVIAGSAPLQNVTAVTKKQIVYMPADTYLNEGIQTYTTFFNDIADAMEKSA